MVWTLNAAINDGSESDDGTVISGGLFEAACDATELLELAEAAFHEMALGIEVLVGRMFCLSAPYRMDSKRGYRQRNVG